jgi:hypothetical protein
MFKVKPTYEGHLEAIFERHFTNEDANVIWLVFGRKHQSLQLIARTIESFTSRTTTILLCKNYARHFQFFSIMIHFCSLWNTLLKEKVNVTNNKL